MSFGWVEVVYGLLSLLATAATATVAWQARKRKKQREQEIRDNPVGEFIGRFNPKRVQEQRPDDTQDRVRADEPSGAAERPADR